jgi:predicted PhzF superfamily epimerase YddE/YHI9
MNVPIYQVDAFTEKLFGGNPAAVCPLEEWLPEGLMQSIALENNLSETAFFVRKKNTFEIRWFTPALEIDLCGHATLASAHVIFEHLGFAKPEIAFFSPKSGALRAIRKDGLLFLDFPAHEARPVDPPGALLHGLGKAPRETYKGRDYLAIFESESDIASLKPDSAELSKLDCVGIIASARGDASDFVSRFFAPRAGVPEDPVTGSSHTLLIPFWAKRLNTKKLHAFQISRRRGELFCEFLGKRVLIGGRAVTFLTGEIRV